jgi:hypothetical protein
MHLYDDLTPWYRLLDPLDDHAAEAACYQAAFTRSVPGELRTLLELGAGAGNTAYHLKPHFRCTLTDLSAPMLELSRELNPECEHIAGDMRTLRLERTFDAVLVHDAIVYMSTEAELRAALETVFVHTRPGGAAIIAPDCTRETFVEQSELYEEDDDGRALRCLEWMWDPDPNDDTYTVDYAFLLRDETGVKAVHDRHVEGLFSADTWRQLLGEAGFQVEMFKRPIDDAEVIEAYTEEVFLCRRA